MSMSSTLWNGIILFFGLGNVHARFGCIKLGIVKTTLLKEITNKELMDLDKQYRKQKFLVGHTLERDIYIRTAKLIEINAYRALRIRQGLPNRGQRTRTNAKTAKKLSGLWEATKFAKKMNKTKTKKRSFNLQYYLKKMKKKATARIKAKKKIAFKRPSNRNKLTAPRRKLTSR